MLAICISTGSPIAPGEDMAASRRREPEVFASYDLS